MSGIDLIVPPDGWQTTRLSTICDLINGDRGKNYPGRKSLEECGIPFVNAGDLQDGVISTAKLGFISQRTYELLNAGKFSIGDILYCIRGSLGKLALNTAITMGAIASSLIIVRPSRFLAHKYVYYYLASPLASQMIRLFDNGTAQPNMSGADLGKFEIPIAGFQTQLRIVAKIEELYSELDKGVESLTTAREQLKAYRQSVLKSAFKGELTESGAEDWTEYSVGELATDIRYGTAKKCSVDPVKTPVLRIPNVASGRIDLADLKHTDFTADELAKLRLESGDILIVRSNGSASLVGLSAIVTEDATGYAYAGYLIRLRINKDIVLPEFLNLYLHSPMVRAGIERQARSSSGVHNVNSDEIRAITLRIPSIPIQRRVVNAVSEIRSQIDALESSVETELTRSNALRQAILQKAFSGQLVLQDPADEPASILLERIRAEKEESGSGRRMNNKNGKKEAA